MSFSLVYLAQRFLYRFFDFFHHWYVDGSRWFYSRYLLFVGSMDQTFAVRVTLRHFFEPLYKDYSVVGRILGVIFRTGRVAIGLLWYAIISTLYAAVFMAWLLAPAATLFLAFVNAPR